MTTALLPLALAALAACGGSPPPPAESASNDTSSLEGSSKESSKSKDPDESSASTPAASSGSSGSSGSTKSSSSASASSAASAAASDAPAPAYHPAPSVTGAIDGKPFSPKVARVVGPMQKDGRITLAVTESAECPASADPSETALTIVMPWSDGYKVDVAALKLPGKKGTPEIAFARANGAKKDFSTTFKPSGTVQVVTAPMTKGATGKLKVDIQSGDYMLNGTLDVLVCVAPK